MKKILCIVLCLTLVLGLGAACSGKGSNTIVVGGKNYTEAILTSEIVAQLIEKHTDYAVERKYDLAAAVCFEGVKSGEIDIFTEYTSGGLINYLKMDPVYDPDEVYRLVKEGYQKEFGMIWLESWGFNNTYGNAVNRSVADEKNLRTNSDLAKISSEMTYGAAHGFYDRDDGYDNMCKAYGFTFKDAVKMDIGLIYQAMSQGQMDVANVYTTDGMLQEMDLVILEDDLNFFPSYHLAAVMNEASLKAHPEVETALAGLRNCATDDDMSRFNYLVDSGKMTIEAAASEFISEKGL